LLNSALFFPCYCCYWGILCVRARARGDNVAIVVCRLFCKAVNLIVVTEVFYCAWGKLCYDSNLYGLIGRLIIRFILSHRFRRVGFYLGCFFGATYCVSSLSRGIRDSFIMPGVWIYFVQFWEVSREKRLITRFSGSSRSRSDKLAD